MPLTDAGIRTLKPAAKSFKRADGHGLNLLVNPCGSKLWRLAYRFEGKQKMISGGAYPAVGLADARMWRDEAKSLLAKGIDPSEHRRKAKQEAVMAAANNFEAVAREWHESRRAKWSERYAWITLRRIEADIFPELGRLPIARIEPADILATIRKVEQRGSIDMARRLNNYIGEVYRYAVALGVAPRDPSRDIMAALRERPPVRHRASIAAADLPTFFAKLAREEQLEPITRLSLLLTLFTLVRTNETRFARWDEFEGLGTCEPLWRIPASRMKMRSEHLVPIAPEVSAILDELRSLDLPGPFLFPGTRRGVMSENTMLFALYRLGYHNKATVHGFRGTASTILNESGLFASDWIERQLAHVQRDQVRAAYNAAQYLPQRRQMLEWWASYLAQQRAVS